MFDGDSVLTLATGIHELPGSDVVGFRDERSRAAALNRILDAAAQCFAAACTQALLSATFVGGAPAYRDLCPQVVTTSSPRLGR
jgi:L-aminopeptidase/D-esterase-like protein